LSKRKGRKTYGFSDFIALPGRKEPRKRASWKIRRFCDEIAKPVRNETGGEFLEATRKACCFREGSQGHRPLTNPEAPLVAKKSPL
jgi:hypothetical protein